MRALLVYIALPLIIAGAMIALAYAIGGAQQGQVSSACFVCNDTMLLQRVEVLENQEHLLNARVSCLELQRSRCHA